ncbi:MAG: ABC transporter substrate-binding protein, partial [Pseudomonadota bacterium]
MLFRIGVCAIALAAGTAAQSSEFKWASTTDPQTMDPHAVNSAPVLGFLNNVYEGLVRRGKDMSIEPALATSWEPIGDGEGWRFKLREGVTFHDGATFDAQDVQFSYQRASSEQADTSSWFSPVSSVIVVDDYTVDIMTSAPNPIFPSSIANWMMMDSGWAEANDAMLPDKDNGNFATLNANGTGAFRVTTREPGLRTVLEPFGGWWDTAEHNVTRAELTPIQNPATAVAALLSGEVDMINPVPIQDAVRLSESGEVDVIQGIEARVIMLGFAQDADQLKFSADAGKPNPFLDPRVRQAVAHAINVPAILQTIMRGNAEPASQLVSPAMNGFSASLADRPAFDVDKAKALLAEAGHEDGFSFGLKCPNDRYLNDESVCQATVAMLAQVIASVLVCLLAVVAAATMDSLDKVVSLMGSLLGCPIAFVFPPL